MIPSSRLGSPLYTRGSLSTSISCAWQGLAHTFISNMRHVVNMTGPLTIVQLPGELQFHTGFS